MSLILRWRVPGRAIVTRWRGPGGMAEALTRDPELPIAAIIGPPGPQGPQGPAGTPLRIDAALSATWILPHTFGRVPMVQVFIGSGEEVITDIAATSASITVTHAIPQAGFVLVH